MYFTAGALNRHRIVTMAFFNFAVVYHVLKGKRTLFRKILDTNVSTRNN